MVTRLRCSTCPGTDNCVCDRLAGYLRQRRDAVVAMRDQGHSLRAIADALGVDTATVNSDLLAKKTMGPWGRI